jgi:Flp pilus assembly protein protease CpaA
MDWIIFGHVALWLGILSWFDIRKREIPHSAWVVIPLLLAGGYRLWQGDWKLVLLAAAISAVSERERISKLLRTVSLERLYTLFPVLFLAAALSIPTSPFSALAIIGFWVAWEFGWWGGADAVGSITVCLIWPGASSILAFLLVHVSASVGLIITSWVRQRKVMMHRIPGIPLLFLSVLLIQLFKNSLS